MFLKVCNVDRFFKSSSREFQSLMEEGIHGFCEILVLLKGTDIFLYYFILLKEELNLVYMKVQCHYLPYT